MKQIDFKNITSEQGMFIIPGKLTIPLNSITGTGWHRCVPSFREEKLKEVYIFWIDVEDGNGRLTFELDSQESCEYTVRLVTKLMLG